MVCMQDIAALTFSIICSIIFLTMIWVALQCGSTILTLQVLAIALPKSTIMTGTPVVPILAIITGLIIQPFLLGQQHWHSTGIIIPSLPSRTLPLLRICI